MDKLVDVKKEVADVPTEVKFREVKKLTDDYIVDDETYFADQMYVTNSMLKNLLTGSTYNLKHYLESEHKETESLLVGSAFHCMLLEPDEFDKRYVYEPKFDKRTKAGKEAYAEFEQTLNGRKPIPEHYQEAFETMLVRLESHDNARELIKDATKREVIHFWEDVKTGLKCKGKNDSELILRQMLRDEHPYDLGGSIACIVLDNRAKTPTLYWFRNEYRPLYQFGSSPLTIASTKDIFTRMGYSEPQLVGCLSTNWTKLSKGVIESWVKNTKVDDLQQYTS